MYYESFLAGMWAATGSTLGKLTSSSTIVGDSYLIWCGLLIAMVVANTWGCRLYLRSLDEANNSVSPTVISAASSYVLSGLIGVVVFDEGASVRWWLGNLLIIIGLSLVAQDRQKSIPKEKQG